jgi:hypothetical protein
MSHSEPFYPALELRKWNHDPMHDFYIVLHKNKA